MLVAGTDAVEGLIVLKHFRYGLAGKALCSGFSAWLISVLLAALFCSPVVATHHDFNHFHPEGTPEHYHGIDSTLGSPVITDLVVITAFFTVLAVLALQSRLPAVRLLVWPANQARAPPGRQSFTV
jgi:hypothetical protein